LLEILPTTCLLEAKIISGDMTSIKVGSLS